MKHLLMLGMLVALGYVGAARADVYKTTCFDDVANAPFTIEANTAAKVGLLTHKGVRTPLKITKVKVFDKALVLVEFVDPATRERYKVDYVKPDRPKNSVFTRDMEDESTIDPDGSQYKHSCGVGAK